MTERFFVDQDNDSHWYVVPVEKRAEWEAWLNLDSDDEAAWNAPDWARAMDGSPSEMTFENPVFNED